MENQLTLFDFIRPEISIDKPIRLIELFAGYGSQALALEYLGVDFEHYRAVEFDKYAIASYNAIHGTNFPVMDVTKISGKDLGIINKSEFTYLLTYSFPCTDLSVAGQMKGMEEGSGTRSSLLWEVRRLLEETEELPQILLMENVTQVHSKKNMPHFQKWLDFLESKGYTSYMQDLNARDYGVAQNRNRTFLISFLGDYNYEFPKKIELKSVMKDYLEDEVEDKYYLTSEKAKKLIDTLILDGKILDKESRDKTRLNERTNERTNERANERTSGQQLTFASKSQELSTGQTALKPDTTMESQTYKQTEAVLLSGMSSEKRKPGIKQIDVACTLCARDYKGLNNYGSNGVLECEKIT